MLSETKQGEGEHAGDHLPCGCSAGRSGGFWVIVSPLGEILAGPNFESEAILTADLDPGAIARGKYDFDVVGHYAIQPLFAAG